MALTPEVEELLEFLKLDKEWIKHLKDYDYRCGCTIDRTYSGFNPTTPFYCEKWQSKLDLQRAREDLQRAQRRYDEARLAQKIDALGRQLDAESDK